ncbi:prostacyclin synthase [Pseudophryne corroboree]|uniref:prostacyclin synthase n=1 Tax=Pseudophryne corroboree TaxID=495146 RepID=UPI0030815244
MIAALFLCVILTALIWAAFLRRCRQQNEPPLDCGYIPWLGHALEFGRDAATFLTRMKTKYGNIFTVQVAGKFVTVLLDPHSYDNVVLESKDKLDFEKYAKILMERMFDVRLPEYDVAAEKAMLRLHLQNKSLPHLTSSMLYNLSVILNDSSVSGTTWREDGLFNFTYGIMLRAGYLTLFGSESSPIKDINHSKEVYNEFRKLDQLLMKSARGILCTEEKKAMSLVRENLWHIMNSQKVKRKERKSDWLKYYLHHLEDLQVSDEEQTKILVLQLWATQGNAGPATFWFLLFLLKHPEAMVAVQGELEKVFQARSMKQMEDINQELLDNAVIFNSALAESLRLTAAPFITREVLTDQLLKLADGREYVLRSGDRLCLFPYVSPQMDPEVHQEPQVYQYNRFLNGNGTQKNEFYKGGRRLKHFTMPWGAGNNVCVGRFHAINSIKLFVWFLLLNFEFELKNPNEKLPDFDRSRYGFGVVQPEHDIVFRYRRRLHVSM